MLFCFFLSVMLSKDNDIKFLKSALAYIRVFMCIYVYVYGSSVSNEWLVSEYTFLNARFWIAF